MQAHSRKNQVLFFVGASADKRARRNIGIAVKSELCHGIRGIVDAFAEGISEIPDGDNRRFFSPVHYFKLIALKKSVALADGKSSVFALHGYRRHFPAADIAAFIIYLGIVARRAEKKPVQ